jgi:protein-disulfide isomerase
VNVSNRRQFNAFFVGVAGAALSIPHIAHAEADIFDASLAQKLLETVPILGERSMGDTRAPVVLIEYASPTCQNTAEFNSVYWPSIKTDFVDTGKVRFIFREFPLDNLALRAFMILRCVPEEKYFAVLDRILSEQKAWRGKDALRELARIMETVGISEEKVRTCASDTAVARAIFETQRANMDQFGFNATPTFFVSGLKLDGKNDPASIRPAIEAALTRM